MPPGSSFSFSPRKQPMARKRFSPYWLYSMKSIPSLSTPAASRADAILNVPGNTELAKLFVSVVIPAISGVPSSTGNFPAAEMSGMAERMSYSSSQVEETPVSLNTRS